MLGVSGHPGSVRHLRDRLLDVRARHLRDVAVRREEQRDARVDEHADGGVEIAPLERVTRA